MAKFNNNDEGITKLSEYIISKFGDISKYKIINKRSISSLFLAGAPGAGKTEFLDTIFSELKENFIVIDIDKYRNYFKGYSGDNSSDYQNSSVKVADKILKFCFKNDLNFVFDGTFRNYNKVKQNFEQCKKYNRKTLITLIYQEPRISFYYTYLRKVNKKRNVPIDVFINGFYCSIENLFKAKKYFGNVEIIIANKKYHPLNKNKYKYIIDYEINNINKFCKTYNIAYKNGIFKNAENLKLDLNKFKDILDLQYFSNGKNLFLQILRKIRIWLYEKTNKI